MVLPLTARRLSRRSLIGIGAATAAGVALGSCAPSNEGGVRLEPSGGRPRRDDEPPGPGELRARPRRRGDPAGAGLRPLGLGGRRDGLVYVPTGYRGRPTPLVLTLHGAGGGAERGMNPFLGLAEDAGVILVAPDSRGRTWDVLLGGFGPDVAFIDRALKQVFGTFAIDSQHVGVEGFSDGASYALSIGITNGDLFTHVMAFSPGFMAPGAPKGKPRLFITHGIEDDILPIDRTSRKIVPTLRGAGYDVTYKEFDGGHRPWGPLTAQALGWFLR